MINGNDIVLILILVVLIEIMIEVCHIEKILKGENNDKENEEQNGNKVSTKSIESKSEE